MSPLTQVLLTNLALLTVAMLLLWIIATLRRDASLIDVFWGCGFVLIAWVTWLIVAPSSQRALLLVVLTTIWGLRLSLHLLRRKWGEIEDHRYAAMRARHGERFWWVSLFTVFLLQGLILWFVALPIQVAVTRDSSAPIGWVDLIGFLVWVIGLSFEAIGDWQLARFKSDPANAHRVMDRGLWRYTRHPNYFGDFCVWWGLYVIAAVGGAVWTIGSPLLMSVLLMKVSGVALLESTIMERRPEYAAYRARTNAFFPGWPR
jgi:steroid 5-alpha reductase family enzyme